MNQSLKKYYSFLESISTPDNKKLVNAVMEAAHIIFEQAPAPQQNLPPEPEPEMPPMPSAQPPAQEMAPAPAPQAAPAPAPQQQEPAPPSMQNAGDVQKNVEKVATQAPPPFRQMAPEFSGTVTELQKAASNLLPQIASYTAKNPNDKEAQKFQEYLQGATENIAKLSAYVTRATQMGAPPSPMQQAPMQQAPMPQ
jgi:hypothetical protein